RGINRWHHVDGSRLFDISANANRFWGCRHFGRSRRRRWRGGNGGASAGAAPALDEMIPPITPPAIPPGTPPGTPAIQLTGGVRGSSTIFTMSLGIAAGVTIRSGVIGRGSCSIKRGTVATRNSAGGAGGGAGGGAMGDTKVTSSSRSVIA